VGGRARTDVHPEGFLLDRGFQIFLTGYPEAKRVLDYDDLDLKPFYAGALVRYRLTWHRVADPFRHPLDGLLSLLPSNAVGTPIDKVNVGIFRLKCVLGGSLEALLKAEPERATRERLAAEGFSESIVDRFFRPFLGGIFFDRSLGVSDRLFAFVMRMLATGSNCLPAKGIGAMGEQLARGLPRGTVRLGKKVEAIDVEGGKVRVASSASGSSPVVVTARKAVVVASEGPEARRLVEGALSGGGGGGGQASSLVPPTSPAVGTACLYFDAPPSTLPSNEAILYLNGELSGPQDQALVNNCCFPSTVAPSYAPPGRALVSVSTIGTRPELDDAALEAGVRKELSAWFGEAQVASWRHLRTYRIPYAQPPQAPPTNLRKSVAVSGGGGAAGGLPLFVCGDHMDTATFDGALLSGRRAAEAVLEVVGRKVAV
jgi:phytoene dehydrogenase-like protein